MPCKPSSRHLTKDDSSPFQTATGSCEQSFEDARINFQGLRMRLGADPCERLDRGLLRFKTRKYATQHLRLTHRSFIANFQIKNGQAGANCIKYISQPSQGPDNDDEFFHRVVVRRRSGSASSIRSAAVASVPLSAVFPATLLCV